MSNRWSGALSDSKAKDTKDSIEAALEYGIDIIGRRIFLHGDVDGDSIGRTIRGLYLLDNQSNDKIELYVSSFGGDLEEVFALHDVTRTIDSPVHTIALGRCQSAAPLLVACGFKGERWATENTRFMLHNSHVSDVDGTPEQVAAYNDEIKRLGSIYNSLLARYTVKPKRFWDRLQTKSTDYYFDAYEAKELGLIDKVWIQK